MGSSCFATPGGQKPVSSRSIRAAAAIQRATAIAWNQHRQMPRRSSPVLVDGAIFSVSDDGIASCLDAASGDIAWTKRLKGTFSASLLYAGGRIYAFNEQGDGYVFAADRSKYTQLAPQQAGGWPDGVTGRSGRHADLENEISPCDDSKHRRGRLRMKRPSSRH